MKIGYVRVSSRDQNLDRQITMLEKYKIDKLFQEKASGKNCDRPEFQNLMNYIREGDCVIVSSLDRLGRNYEDIKKTVTFMKKKNVSLQIIDAPFLNFDTGNELLDTAMFDMFLSLLSYIAQNEREKIKERQRQGILLAKEAGRYKGRPTEYGQNAKNPQKRIVYQTILTQLKQGKSITKIAEDNGVSRPTVYKIKKENQL